MFRGASLNTQPIEGDPPTEPRGTFLPWSWPMGARVLLVALVMSVALGLRMVSRDVRPASKAVTSSPELVLDPNTASQKALTALPHIGPALASRLVEARTERPFSSLDDLKDRVRGVGPVTLAQIAPYLQIDVVPGFTPETLIASQGRPSGRKPKASRRKTVRPELSTSSPIQPRLAARSLDADPR
jgi:Helix-hairpin-helix motif